MVDVGGSSAKWLVFTRKGTLQVFSEVMLLEVVCVVSHNTWGLSTL